MHQGAPEAVRGILLNQQHVLSKVSLNRSMYHVLDTYGAVTKASRAEAHRNRALRLHGVLLIPCSSLLGASRVRVPRPQTGCVHCGSVASYREGLSRPR